MKKIILLAACFLMAGTVANAQTSTTTSTVGNTKWGLKVGVNLAKYSYGADDAENPETDHATNFHVTGYLDLPLGGMFSVQPGLSLQGKGAEYFDDDILGTRVETKENVMWLEVPVNFVGKIPLGATGTNIFLGAGPYGAYALSGEIKTEVEGAGNDDNDSTEKLNFGNDDSDDRKALDFGINFLGGVQLNNGFNIGAGYGLGLSDLRPSGSGGNGQMTNRVLSFSVGYSF